jgi:4-amino-4-deoxy-L-arabinose transferase-like glycosyltransferase
MEPRKFSVHQVFVLFTLAVVLIVVLPDLLRHGMFMDGTQYAIISKNYAEGKGTFWFPFLSSSWDKQGQNAFLEHPPLVYFLQSVFFKIGGESFLSERMYCFVTLLLSTFLIILIWRVLFKFNERYKNFYWFPVLLWIVIPSVSWSFKNNMHENTLSVFVLTSVYCLLRSMQNSRANYFWILLASLFIFLASLSKGLPGLFPLVFFVLYKYCFKTITWKRAFGNTLLLLAMPVLLYFLIMTFSQEGRESLMFHIKNRLLYRIEHDPQVENRLITIFWLLCDIVVPVVLLLPMAGLRSLKGQKALTSLNEPFLKRSVLLFAFIGAAGVLPLCFTHVQRAVYFVPALPFLAIALALLFIREIEDIVVKIGQCKTAYKVFATISVIAFISAIVISCKLYGGTWRDEMELADVKLISQTTGDNTIVSAPFEIYQEWGFQYYLLRYHNITIDPRQMTRDFVLIEKDDTEFKDSSYQDTRVALSKYKLLKKISSP